MEKYNHQKIEKKWQDFWDKKKIWQAKESKSLAKFYVLDMFPYPSAEGLHVGHPEGYTASDIVSRYLRMKGYNVLHPMGWDAFGLPAENYAIKTGIHPKISTEKNIKKMRSQIKFLGFSYDWSREINTTDPDYYKWTQWIFLQMFKKGLAYESTVPINWCPSCKTGLANEEVINGRCERCNTVVTKKNLRQWLLKITKYADRLLNGLDKLDWPEPIKLLQRNWIGRSEGAIVKFEIRPFDFAQVAPSIVEGRNSKHETNTKFSAFAKASADKQIQNPKLEIEVFTTRPDTLFGATYMVLSPEHPLMAYCLLLIANRKEVEVYVEKARNKSDLERTELVKDKTGVELKGMKAINPVNNKEIPIWIADYVLASYGTGAIMAVPAHDERDYEFAKRYKLPIIKVIKPPKLKKQTWTSGFASEGSAGRLEADLEAECWIGEGTMINSEQFNGLFSGEGIKKITKWLEENKLGRKAVNYKLRDWVFSRQRYWGEPIPVVHCEKCGVVPVPEKDLPVKLPEVKNYKPTGTGESPLANIKEWVNVKCPKCGSPAKRETNTMPQWAGSCWYYLRYLDPKNKKELVSKEKEKYWMGPSFAKATEGKGVDLYVGGAEHAVLHLLYARFWHMFLYDIGVVSTAEPFYKLKNQGIILGEDNQKMSKSRGNVINPDDVIKEFGADSMRLYEMFMGPFEDVKPWSTKGLVGMYRFLDRIWKVLNKIIEEKDKLKKINNSSKLIHKTIKKVTEDIENFKFNTAISELMIFFNERDWASKLNRNGEFENGSVDFKAVEKFLMLLSPFAPHMSEELWQRLGHKKNIVFEKWPNYDPKIIVKEEFELIIQVDGKLRDRIKVKAGISEEEAKKMALNSEKVKKYVKGEPKKVIFVKGRLINFVV